MSGLSSEMCCYCQLAVLSSRVYRRNQLGGWLSVAVVAWLAGLAWLASVG